MTSEKIERFCGIQNYSTPKNQIYGKLKTRPEDFIVEEIDLDGHTCKICDNNNLNHVQDISNKFIEFLLVKKNLDTYEAIRLISSKLNIPKGFISFAGMKDKRALTCQRMSAHKSHKEVLKSIKINNIKIYNVKSINNPVKLGDLYGNYFTITVRDILESPEEITKHVESKIKAIESGNGVLNYFGLQRFGDVRPITHICGKFLLKNDIESCIKTYLYYVCEDEVPLHKEFRLNLLNQWNLKQAIREIPRNLYYEKRIIEELIKNEDYLKAFSIFPSTLQRLFVNAYQSFIFNKYISKKSIIFLEKKGFNLNDQVMILDEMGLPTKIVQTVNSFNKDHLMRLKTHHRACLTAPLIGYETKKVDDILIDLLQEEEINIEDFKFKKFKDLSSKGLFRPIFFNPKNLQLLKIRKDRIFKNKNKLILTFKLKKGTYGTILLREIIKNKKN
ncbi:MAG: tRNA pseudouridine(13) synthase TruD [Candidatus Lokiarchaeota archaeon]|nr:tRNA pseudouridine(13) synthase TruD [Candidatus Lokiarchaeota archaeon]